MDSAINLTAHRQEGAGAAILFVHGFGSAGVAFGNFPKTLAADQALTGWDLYAAGYSTGMLPDLRRLWEADPSISTLATYLRTQLELAPLDSYDGIAIVAHSMGGLVVQRALLDDPGLADRTSHVFMFGTPSNGLRIARWGRFLKDQVEDMAEGGEFITDLRSRWDEEYGEHRPFDLWVVAGDRDAFVPPESSLAPFPVETQVVVPGNHLELVDVPGPEALSHRIVAEALLGDAAPAGPWNSARVAVETSDYDRAIRSFMPHAADLDERHLVDLALALDGTGRREDAIALLREHAGKSGTDALGTLAGRIKRNWMASGRGADGSEALDLYSECLAQARTSADHEQTYYHAINVAFLELAFRRDRDASRVAASIAIDSCRLSPESYWSLATAAEAHLYLGELEQAIEAYADALLLAPDPGQIESTFEQAIAACAELRLPDTARQLSELFRGGR